MDPLPTDPPTITPNESGVIAITVTYADLLAERERLKEQIARYQKARTDDHAGFERLHAQLDAQKREIASITLQLDTARNELTREAAARITAATERDAMARQVADLGNQWVEVNQPFSTLCERVLDSSRLVGFEIEINGERYLIGDVNPGGHREGGQAFRRDAVVTRARARVRK